MLAIYKKMMEVSPNTPKEDLKNLLQGAVFLIVRAIKDIVSSVSPVAKQKGRERQSLGSPPLLQFFPEHPTVALGCK